MNRTASDIIMSFTTYKWASILYIFTGLAIIFENVLMIIVILRDARLRTIANIIVASLAVTDAVVGLSTSIHAVTFIHVKLTSWICKYIYTAVGSCTLGMILSSHLHVAAIAIERYVYIIHPFIYSTYVSERFVVKFMLGLWVFVITFILVAIISGEKHDRCSIEDQFDEIYVYVGCILQLVLLLITSLSYFQIANTALKHRRLVAAQNSGAARHHNNIGPTFKTRNWAQVGKSVCFYLVMTGSLVVFTMPTTICIFVNGLNISIDLNAFRGITFLPIVQSGTNFLINIFMNSDFRKSMKDLFTGKCSL